MVKKFLKIAGVKSEADFYKKYPSEGAFFKAHPEAKDLKQYKQGGQMKKLNQLTNFTNDVDGIIPTAQKGKKCSPGGYGCHGDSKTMTGDGRQKVGSGMGTSDEGRGSAENYVQLSNAPVTWEELLTYNETNPKSKDFKGQLKSLQTEFPDLTANQLLAAQSDSSRIGQRMTNLPRYDQPSEQTFDKAYHNFYRPLMNQQTPVTVPQILRQHMGGPGGLGGYEQTVRGNYGRKRAQDGAPIGSYMSSPMQQTKMLNFSEYMNPVDKMITGSTQAERDEQARKQAEAAAASKQGGGSGGGMEGMLGMASQFMGKGGGGGEGMMSGMGKGRNGLRRAQIGLNQPQNGSMPSNNDPFMYGSPAIGSQQAAPTNPYANPPMMQGFQTGTMQQQIDASAGAVNPKKPFNPMKGIPIAGQIIGGIQQIKAAKLQEKESNKQFQLSGLTKRAGTSRQEPIKRQYVRPEDQVINQNELFPTYGVGTNYMAEDGTQVTRGGIGGNPTEIQNLYNPYDLYEGLGYEPLDDSQNIKRYQGGGMMSGNQFSQIGQGLGAMTGGGGQGTPGGWATIGSAIPGPIGVAAGIVGSVFDGRQQAKIKNFQEGAQKNIVDTASQQQMQGIQGQYSNVMENGGYLSHDWQPQVIASFGGHRVSDLLRHDPSMDTLRSGGHIRQNNVEDGDMGPVSSMALGGELKTHWGGYAEPISQNKFLPDGGETVMFRGKSHDERSSNGETGIGVTYGDSPVEVERNEPAVKLKDGGTNEDSMVVYGNLKISKDAAAHIGDAKAQGRKYKHYVGDLSKQEAKHNKTIEKNLKLIEEGDDVTSFDQMKFFSAKANIDGANMKLKDIATKKINAAGVQNAINEAAEEHGLVADDLAQGKFKLDKKAMDGAAKWGKSIKKAQTGVTTSAATASTVDPVKYAEIMKLYEEVKAGGKGKKSAKAKLLQQKFHEYFPEIAEKIISADTDVTTRARKKGYNNIADLKAAGREAVLDSNLDGIFGDRTEQYITDLQAANVPAPPAPPAHKFNVIPGTTTAAVTTHYPVTQYKGSDIANIYNEVLPYLRPSGQDNLDPNQLYGEMYALSQNQQDPVQAQQFNPLLEQPYDISLQDQLNANQADFNSTQRMMGYNPAAAATLDAQKYAANSSVLGEQFRLNQAEKAGVYNRNRGTLNQAQLQNLGILDQQMVRQATAKSRTKEVGQAALNSISDKIAKHKLDNRTLSIYENMYNYRFDKSGRAINMNPAFQPTLPNVLPIYDDNGNVTGYKAAPGGTPATSSAAASTIPPPPLPTATTTNTTTQRNGGRTQAVRNRDILRMMKGL